MTLVVLAILVVLVLATIKFGSWPERYALVIIVVWIMADQTYHLLVAPPIFSHVDLLHFLIDGVAFSGMLFLALVANRIWPLWLAAAQLVVLLGHLAALATPTGMQRAYWAMTQLPLAIQVMALTIGIVSHHVRFRRTGVYADWRPRFNGPASPPD